MMKWFSNISVCCFSICCTAQSLMIPDLKDNLLWKNENHISTYNIIIPLIYDQFWTFGEFFLYLLVTKILIITYKEAFFKISKCMQLLLYMILFIFSSLQTLSALLTVPLYLYWYSNVFKIICDYIHC